MCVATCATNNDCASDSGHPLCEPDGSCGACITNATCPAAEPICSSTTHECVSCQANTDCASDVCDLTANGCIAEAAIIYLSDDGTNSGVCTHVAPCRSAGYGSSVANTRSWLHILGSSYTVPVDAGARSILIGHAITRIDSTNATIINNDAAPIFADRAGDAPNVTLGSMTIGGAGSGPAISFAHGSVTVRNTALRGEFIVGSGASLLVATSTVDASKASTSSGSTTIQDSTLKSEVIADGGTLTYIRNTFDAPTTKAIVVSGSTTVTVKNSIFLSHGIATAVLDFGNSLGSTSVEFSTFVNGQGTTIAPLTCGVPAGTFVDNIDAWGMAMPSACLNTYSLFNGADGSVSGTGNKAAALSTFFADQVSGDFHLQAGSPALHAGTSTATATDHDSAIRPNPAGSVPDVGAYESPY